VGLGVPAREESLEAGAAGEDHCDDLTLAALAGREELRKRGAQQLQSLGRVTGEGRPRVRQDLEVRGANPRVVAGGAWALVSRGAHGEQHESSKR
jgi:hypothetical protein